MRATVLHVAEGGVFFNCDACGKQARIVVSIDGPSAQMTWLCARCICLAHAAIDHGDPVSEEFEKRDLAKDIKRSGVPLVRTKRKKR